MPFFFISSASSACSLLPGGSFLHNHAWQSSVHIAIANGKAVKVDQYKRHT